MQDSEHAHPPRAPTPGRGTSGGVDGPDGGPELVLAAGPGPGCVHGAVGASWADGGDSAARVAPAALADTNQVDADLVDAGLVRQARSGYLGAYDELVRRHQVRAYTLALRLCGDAEAAKDITQDAFVQAWSGIAGFDERARFATWLHRIVVNASHNAARSRRARPTLPLMEGTPWRLDPASTVLTEQVVQDRMHEEALYRALGVLPMAARAPLVLTAFMDCSYAEAAEILGVPVATVRGRVSRARRILAESMKEWA